MGFFGVFADSLLSRFCFFASVFLHLHFSRTSIFFLTLPLPTHPHSRESGNLPVMPAEGGGFAPSALDREIPAFAGMGRVGMLGFFFRVFADSLLSRFCFFASVFLHLHFSRTSIFFSHSHSPHTPIPAKAGISLCLPAEGGGFAPSALNWEIPAFAGMEKGGNGGGFLKGGKDVEKVWRMVFWGAKKNKKKLSIWEFFCGLCIIRG